MAGARTGARQRLENARGWLLLAAAFSLLALAIVATRMMDSQGRQLGQQQAQITALSGGLSTAEAQLRQHGISPIPKAPSVIVSEVAGPPGPGPSDSQVQSAVDSYLLAHPPTANVDPAALAVTVDAYLSEHPPSPGPPPPTAEVAADVASYLQANPPPSGPAGPQGSPGVGEQGPAGPAGPQGDPGRPPAGWAWTDLQGNTYNCVQDDQTPAPHYTCTLQAPPSPSATPSAPTASTTPTNAATATSAATPAGHGNQGGQGGTDTVADAPLRQPCTPTPTPSPTPTGHHALLPLIALLRREDLVSIES